MIQIIVLSIVSIIAIILITAALMKKEYRISSVILINRPRAHVFDFVVHLRNQEKYSKWVMMDPNVNLNYKGTDGTVGFIAAWKSNNKNVGVGEQEITKIVDGERYVVEIRFEKPFKGISTAITTTKALAQNETKVTTTFHTRSPFPMNLMIPMICKMLQKDMDQNAATLKKVLES
jgi:uncharacterized protein YndB with AHSA1/START domain